MRSEESEENVLFRRDTAETKKLADLLTWGLSGVTCRGFAGMLRGIWKDIGGCSGATGYRLRE